ncbi:hypothetical protein LINPERPRIM_LOCUS23416 [Linum perenne]
MLVSSLGTPSRSKGIGLLPSNTIFERPISSRTIWRIWVMLYPLGLTSSRMMTRTWYLGVLMTKRDPLVSD